MIAEPKFKPHQDDNDRDKRERRRQEEALDERVRGAGQLLSTPPWITMPNLRP